MLDIIDISCYIFLGGTLLFAAFSFANKYYSIKRNISTDGFRKMKQQLLELLREDGYDCKKEENMVVVNYRQKPFRITFSESGFGNRYATVTVINVYAIDDMDKYHPFFMDTLMARATCRNMSIGNIAFEDYCICYFGTDVKNIKDYYRGLRSVLDMLTDNENEVRNDFAQYHQGFVCRNDNQDEKHIGFRSATANQKKEATHLVAAEADTHKST